MDELANTGVEDYVDVEEVLVEDDGFRNVILRLFESAEKGRGRELGPLEVADLVEGFAQMATANQAGFLAIQELQELKTKKKGLWRPS